MGSRSGLLILPRVAQQRRVRSLANIGYFTSLRIVCSTMINQSYPALFCHWLMSKDGPRTDSFDYMKSTILNWMPILWFLVPARQHWEKKSGERDSSD